MMSRDPIVINLVAGVPQEVRLPDCERWQWGTDVAAGQTVTLGMKAPGLTVPAFASLTGGGGGGALSGANVGLGQQAFLRFTGPTGAHAFVFVSGADIRADRG